MITKDSIFRSCINNLLSRMGVKAIINGKGKGVVRVVVVYEGWKVGLPF